MFVGIILSAGIGAVTGLNMGPVNQDKVNTIADGLIVSKTGLDLRKKETVLEIIKQQKITINKKINKLSNQK